MQHFERALQLKPDYAEACCYLGIALASQGKSAEAIQYFQQALNLATAQGNATLAESIRARLQSYPPASP
jgi:Flp pilus assembly protein TadD